MYDYAHPISDAIEGITHSLCTLEFENNRELYDWVIDHTGVSERHGFSRPQQIEFARLNLDYTVMSKRKLLRLVEDGHVSGWDDPRMPTIAGMRRRGYRPEAIRAFADLIGVAKVNSTVDIGKLEFCVRDDLNWVGAPGARRAAAAEGDDHVVAGGRGRGADRALLPGRRRQAGRADAAVRAASSCIDRDDFALDPPAGYQRLAPGRTVRLRHGYCITCDEVVERRRRGGRAAVPATSPAPSARNPPGVKVSGVIHWVSAAHAVPAEVRLYDRLFTVPRPEEADGDLADHLNPDSLQVIPRRHARAEPGRRRAGQPLAAGAGRLLRRRPEDSRPGALVLNRIVTLRDSWAGRDGRRTPPAAGRRSGPSRPRPRPVRPRGAASSTGPRPALRDPVLAERFAAWPARARDLRGRRRPAHRRPGHRRPVRGRRRRRRAGAGGGPLDRQRAPAGAG